MNTVTLNWTNPTTRADSSAMPVNDISAIQIWDGHDGAAPVMIASLGNPTQPTWSFTTPPLKTGKHIFYLIALDQAGNASDNSAQIEVDVPAPGVATGLTAQYNP